MSEQFEQDDREALLRAMAKRVHNREVGVFAGHDDFGTCASCEESVTAVLAAGFRRSPEPLTHPEGHVALVPLAWVLEAYEDGDERGWDAEFEFLRREHSSRIDQLATSIQEVGMQEPVLLGSDGRVWDGHHRLCVAQMLGLTTVPVLLPARSPAPQRASQPVHVEVTDMADSIRDRHYAVEIEPSDTICGACSMRLPNGKYFGKLVEWPCDAVQLATALGGGE